MPLPTRKMRISFALMLVIAAAGWAAFLPEAQAQQTLEEQCAASGNYGTACAPFVTGASDPADATPTPTPPPTPTPTPTPDPQQEHDDALAMAIGAIEDELRAPGWNVWPPKPFQVVNLETFMLVTDNWETHDVPRTVGAVTVTVFAEPKRTFWTLKEVGTGTVHPVIECTGPGSEWTEDATDADCGWTAIHSSDVTGELELEVEIEFDLHWTSSYLGTSGTIDTRRSRPSATRSLVVSEVQAFAFDTENVVYDPEDPDTTSPGDNPDGSVPGESEDDNPFPHGMPTKTETCSVWGEVGGGVLFVDLDTGLGAEIIVETYADGSQVVTIAGDVGVSAGTDVPSFGAAITVNDSVLGAFYKAEASAWGTIGAGAVYVLEPGDSVQDLLIDIAIDKGTGPGGEVINGIAGVFGQQPIPEAPPADAVFVDVSLWGEAEVTGAFGAEDIQSAVGASVEAGVNVAGKKYTDGRYSVITTFFGNIDGQFKSKIGEDGLEISGQAVGQFQVETIFDADGNMLEAVVTTSYGIDGDVLVDDEADDPFTVTNQQWTIDLTDPEARDAFLYDLNVPAMLDEYGTTSGSHEFIVEDNTTTIAIGADLALIEGGGKLEFGCTTVS